MKQLERNSKAHYLNSHMLPHGERRRHTPMKPPILSEENVISGIHCAGPSYRQKPREVVFVLEFWFNGLY